MDSAQNLSICSGSIDKEKNSLDVDPFLVEALQNPRHRLTILRMELDIQKFLQSPEQRQFEFQHFPTSYLRLAAHRVAQHYGLQTMVLENLADGQGTKIAAIRTAETKHPSVCLSDIPAKESENGKHDLVKISIRRRPSGMSSGDGSDLGMKRNAVRSVEERKEEYDKARARIFSNPNSPASDEVLSQGPADGKVSYPIKDESGECKNIMSDSEKNLGVRDVGTSSRVAAIFKDREKDRSDPDYDRSYDRDIYNRREGGNFLVKHLLQANLRYVRSFPSNQIFLPPFSMPKYQLPLGQYEAAFPQMGQLPRAQTSLNYGPSSDPSMNPYCTMGLNQGSRGAVYMQWPSPAMMYAHSYEQLRHNVFQVPFCQQPLSFDYTQNH